MTSNMKVVSLLIQVWLANLSYKLCSAVWQ